MDIDAYLEKLKQKQFLTSEETKKLISKSTEIFAAEPNIPEVPVPVTVCGDIHGQFHDLMELFKICGKIPYTK
jgi:serine/threonine-protein phosphatase 2A catalytic subunit